MLSAQIAMYFDMQGSFCQRSSPEYVFSIRGFMVGSIMKWRDLEASSFLLLPVIVRGHTMMMNAFILIRLLFYLVLSVFLNLSMLPV